MKRFIVISAIISAFVVLNSCEKHDWEDTKKLHVDKAKKEDGHGHGEQGEHSDAKDH
jgi:hypothetical protein